MNIDYHLHHERINLLTKQAREIVDVNPNGYTVWVVKKRNY